jgi:hypothetical protein
MYHNIYLYIKYDIAIKIVITHEREGERARALGSEELPHVRQAEKSHDVP